MTSAPPVERDDALAAAVLSHWDWAALLMAARDRYPRIAHLRLPDGADVHLLTHPDTIVAVMRTQARHTVKDFPPGLRAVLGESLTAVSGPAHLAVRRVVQPAFGPEAIAADAEAIRAVVREQVRGWPAGVVVDLACVLSRLTLDVFGRVLCGKPLAGWSDDVRRFQRDPADPALPASVDALLAERRVRRGAGDLVDRLVDAEAPPVALSDARVHDEVRAFVVNAAETPGVSLAWLVFLLGTNPGIVDRLRAGAPAQLATDWPLARACYAEALRLYPAAWRQERVLTADLDVDGRLLPVGSRAMASALLTHRDARFWPRPTAFEPDRWLGPDGGFDERAPGQPDGAWFPFGFGNRRCVGEHLSWSTALALTAELVATWDVELVDPAAVRPLVRVTYRPAGGLPAVLRARG